MPTRKMRVELFDSEGNRYTVAFEGQITRDKALRLLDLMELLGGMPAENQAANADSGSQLTVSSRLEKVRFVIQKNFPLVWFSSKDIRTVYETELKEPISLSTVSTYLARMANKGLLLRAGGSNNLKYKISTSTPETVIRQKLK
ncbi:MAG: hypothetical protein ACE14S_09725 [Candidatus Bathyarchaeia archaeon]